MPYLTVCRKTLLILFLAMLAAASFGAAAATAPPTVPVVMMSDIHFDPFHDPAKFASLQTAPVSGWARVLSSPDSSTQADDFAALQKTCKAKGVDTDWPLLASSLKAAQHQQSAPLFVTLSGDLMAHDFECRFQTLAPKAGPAAYAAFAEKTVAFVALQLRLAFPRVPVYVALGNNDSGCGDYHETPGSGFLRAVAKSVAGDVPADERASVLSVFPEQGDYTVPLPKPMQSTRLVVLQDIFQSTRYKTCSGTADNTAAKTQIAWLAQKLAEARRSGEHVWVMAHIPPGVDAYSTFRHAADVCTSDSPALFLSSNGLAQVLSSYADVVRMVVLAHTHNDEMRLLGATGGPGIPAKLIPSISPVHGNNSAFVVAAVNLRTAVMTNYSVFTANNQTGVATTWSMEYRYSTTYGLPDFSAASVKQLIAAFAADAKGESASSRAYQSSYAPGESLILSVALETIWPGYVCSMSAADAASFRTCVCGSKSVKP
jgi:sphingomyelin phosphodiesterase acid-like 3